MIFAIAHVATLSGSTCSLLFLFRDRCERPLLDDSSLRALLGLAVQHLMTTLKERHESVDSWDFAGVR